jgi:hypothetical protein
LCILKFLYLYMNHKSHVVILVRFGNTLALGSHPWVPLAQENALVGGTCPTTKPTCGDKHGSALCTPTWFSLSSPANIISLLRFHCPLAAICYDCGGPIPSLPGLFGMGQDHYGPTRGPFLMGMWQLAHVKAYIRPILPRINTVAP